jgi:hypothetical protein
MTSNRPEISQLIVEAFQTSQKMQSAVAKEWIAASFRAGSKIPESAVSTSIQRLGDLDTLCRSMEDDLVRQPPIEGGLDLRIHYLRLLSDLWVGSAYAICYAFSDRGLYKGDQDFERVAEDLKLVRVQLEKHQIASDNKLDQPLNLVTDPGQSSAPIRMFQYDRKDRLRAHICRTGLSKRYSMMWEVIDVKKNTDRWLERRSLADELLKALLK